MPAQPITVSSILEERLKGRRAALDALRDLPEDYQLFYSPSLREKNAPVAEPAEPAVDYLLAHKEKGLLGIVVKSGEIVEEPGGFISQYQPQKQLYKIIDPIKPADMALRALLMGFDANADRIYPCGVAVIFPDSQRFEFSLPKTSYLFGDDIASEDFQKKLDELFLEPVDKADLAAFKQNFNKLGEFLKVHSDNAAVFEARKEKPKLIEAKRATPPVVPQSNLRMKVAAARQAEQAAAPQEKVEAVAPPPVIEAPPAATAEKPAEIAARNSLAMAKAEKAQATIALPVAASSKRKTSIVRAALPEEKAKQRDLFVWIQEVEERDEGEVRLSTLQWAMVIGVSVAIICGAYFLSRHLAMVAS